MNEKQLRQAVFAEAKRWLETPWLHHQLQKGVGCDCVGLVVGVGNHALGMDFHWDLPEALPFKGYSQNPEPDRMRRGLCTFLDFVSIKYKDAKMGDVVWLRVRNEPQHLAILGDRETIVHADMKPGPGAPTGKVRMRTITPLEKTKIIGVFRYKRITEQMKLEAEQK